MIFHFLVKVKFQKQRQHVFIYSNEEKTARIFFPARYLVCFLKSKMHSLVTNIVNFVFTENYLYLNLLVTN